MYGLGRLLRPGTGRSKKDPQHHSRRSSSAAAAGPAPAGWADLPDDLLLPILVAASTRTTPGSCLAAGVCRRWRAGARRLIRHQQVLLSIGSLKRARSFAAWLAANAPSLQALDLDPCTLFPASRCRVLGTVHKALALAADAAAAAGQPLPLQELTLCDQLTPVSHLGRLLRGLPHLTHLVLDTHPCPTAPEDCAPGSALVAAQGLSQLRYCSALCRLALTTAGVTFDRLQQQLPVSLQDLSVVVVGQECFQPYEGLDLGQLSRLTRLQLSTAGKFMDPKPFQALPALKGLELTCNGLGPGMSALRSVLVNLSVPYVQFDFLSALTALTALSVGWGAADMVVANLVPALPRLTRLVSASFRLGAVPQATPPRLTGQILAACQELTALREVDLVVPSHMDCGALSLLSQVTALSLHIVRPRAKKHPLTRLLPEALRAWVVRREGADADHSSTSSSSSAPPPSWCAAIIHLKKLQWLGIQGRVLIDPEAGGWLTALTALTGLTVRPWRDQPRLRCSYELAGGLDEMEALVEQVAAVWEGPKPFCGGIQPLGPAAPPAAPAAPAAASAAAGDVSHPLAAAVAAAAGSMLAAAHPAHQQQQVVLRSSVGGSRGGSLQPPPAADAGGGATAAAAAAAAAAGNETPSRGSSPVFMGGRLQQVLLETWGQCLPLDGGRVMGAMGAAMPGVAVTFYRCPERLRAATV